MLITPAGCRTRRQRLWDALDPKPDWILLASSLHLMYFANYYASPFVFRSANASALLVLGRDGSSTLIADSMVGEFADQAHVDEVVAPEWYNGQKSASPRGGVLLEAALRRLANCSGSRFGVDAASTPVGVVEGLRSVRGSLELIDVEPIVHRLRRPKDVDELEIMRRSMQAGDAAHAAAMRDVRPGMTEREVYLLVQNAATQAAGEQVWVYGDFVSGPRCETKGGPPSDRRIEKGDLVLLDFSVVISGYRGDFANTFCCGAAPTDEQRRLYAACIKALAVGEGLIRAGQDCREMDRAIRASFAAEGLAENFVTHSGHGVGLGHPDPPYLVPESSDRLAAGDVITIEPGQYVPGVAGMRYERNYLVTETGYELLSHLELKIDPQA